MIDENVNPFTVPYSLTKVPGGLDGYGLKDVLIQNISGFLKVKQSVFDETAISGELTKIIGEVSSIPPSYFKLRTLKEVCLETKEIFIYVDDNQPVCNCGDGVYVNIKAA